MADDAKKPVPDGAVPLFLTMTTQEKFGCKEREDVTPEMPYVKVSQKFFLEDIQFRGAISDFHSSKKLIAAYPEPELLIVWDEEEDYGQNFYLVTKLELAQQIMADVAAKSAAVEEAAEAEASGGGAYEVEEYKPPESKPWVSQGSEAEITEETIVPTRERFVLRMSRPRRDLGAPHKFSDRDSHEDPNMQDNGCRSYKDPNFELKRTEHDIGIQALPELEDAKTQTTWFRPVNKAVQYDAQTMSLKERNKVLGSAALRDFLAVVRDRYELALQQNETIDLFQDDFAVLAEEEASLGNKADSDLRELQSFNHLQYCAGRMVSFTDWQPHGKGMVVGVACAQRLGFEDRVLVAGKVHTGYILLWNFSDPIHPQFVLEAPGDVFCFRFCPTNADIVVGGVSSGQVVCWNLAHARDQARELKAITGETAEEGGHTIVAKPVYLSAVELSHRFTVTDLVWLPPKLDITEKGKFVRKAEATKQTQFCTVAADGQVLFWDLEKAAAAADPQHSEGTKEEKNKNLGWGPTYRLALSHLDSNAEPSCVHMIFDVPEAESAPCRMFCTTEEGEFLTIDLVNPGSEEGTRGLKSVVAGHYSACTSLQRSPFVRDVHLSVGDWTFNLWKEGVASPLFTAPFAACLLTCGVWSPTRPAVVAIGKADGSIDVWDLLDRAHEPSMSVNITSASITSMHFHSTNTKQLLAVGDDQGTVHVMEVPRNLRRAANNEKSFTLNFFEREVKRVNYVQQREVVRKEQAAADAAKASEISLDKGEEDKTGDDEKLEKAFRAMEEKFKEEMGIVDAEPATGEES